MEETYQINFAGNTDFANLMARGLSKHKTKQEAVTSLMPYPVKMSTGFTHVPLMKDRKTSIFYIQGANFGNAPLRLEAKLEVEDSANFAGVIVDMVRSKDQVGRVRWIGEPSSAASSRRTRSMIQPPNTTVVEALAASRSIVRRRSSERARASRSRRLMGLVT